jgi:hypothetical protein
MAKHPCRDVIVLLPGIMGSVLERDGKEVWAPSLGAIARGLLSGLDSIQSLRLDADPPDKDDLGDGVVATRLIPDVRVIPGLIQVDAYSGLSDWITSTFDVTPGTTFLEFPYDWRRDNRVHGRRLKAVTDRALFAARKENPDAKLVLICHSMGGLVARSFLELQEGWRDTRMLITLGTPYRGAVNAVDFVANGFVKKIGPFKVADLSDLLLSLTSVHQLLPIYPCIDTGDGTLKRVTETPIPHLDPAKATAALAFHHSIQDAVGARPPDAYGIFPIVGIEQPTRSSARLTGTSLKALYTYDGEEMAGDGTVPRPSATPIELDGQTVATFSVEQHGPLVANAGARSQILGLLTQPEDIARFRDARPGLAMRMDDLFAVGEPVALDVRPQARNVELHAELFRVEGGTEIPVGGPVPLRAGDEGHQVAELAPPGAPGGYRVTVSGVGDSAEFVQPVTGLFLVVDDVVGG